MTNFQTFFTIRIRRKFVKIPPHLTYVAIHYFVKCQCLKATTEKKTSVTTHFRKSTTGTTSQLYSKVTVIYCSFYIKCSMCPSYCWKTHSLKCVVTEVLFSVVAFKTLTFHKRHTRGVVESIVIVLLQMFSWFRQSNKFENRSIFGEVNAYEVEGVQKSVPIFWATLYIHVTVFYKQSFVFECFNPVAFSF